ncbi:MAG: hypothetical protein WBJ41_09365 [Chromatiaceae bacterium]
MLFFKLMLAFSPWLAFLVIAHGSLQRLQIGLVVALVLSIIMGITGMHRGVILWAGLLFFASATLAVVVFENLWVVHYMGLIASSVLAIATWLTVLLKKPFTLDYAKQHTPPSLWSSPTFIWTNMVLTSAWGAVFTVNALLAWGKMEHFLLPELGYEVISYALLIGTAAFTTWYPNHVRARQAA